MARLRPAPGPRLWEMPGVIVRLRQRFLQTLIWLRQQHGDVMRMRVGPRLIYLIAHPDGIRRVLLDHQSNYTKQTRGYEKLRLLLGNGLVTSEGKFWLRQRRIAQPAFHRQRIAKFGQVMTGAAEQMIEAWPKSGNLDVAHEMSMVTLNVVSQTLLTTDLHKDAHWISDGVQDTLGWVSNRARRMFNWPDNVPTPAKRRFDQAKADFDQLIYEAIADRRKNPGQHDDLLNMLLEAKDEETGEQMTDTQLRDEAITIFGAGHETTANALMWTFVLLSQFPDAERRLQVELKEVLDGRSPTIDDLPNLKFTENVVKESMRLYPPVYAVSRRVAEDDEIDGYRIEQGAQAVISTFVTHRHPDLWTNPEGFDPDRFDTEAVQNQPRFTYFPFLGGPRQCIGNTFALMEAKLILATVAQHYSLRLIPGRPVTPHAAVTLRPRGGLVMQACAASRTR